MNVARFLGWLLQGRRAGEGHLAVNHLSIRGQGKPFTLSSTWFGEGDPIPADAAGPGVGANISPPLSWSGLPDGTKSLLLVIQDPDAPLRKPFVHCVATASADSIGNDVAAGDIKPPTWSFGRNTGGSVGYRGPRALPGHGVHDYVFQLFALSRTLPIASGDPLERILDQAQGLLLGRAMLRGTFERK